MTRDWDARTYDRVADPMTRWGAAVLDRLPLEGDERVLDAGCGSGRVTELLAARLPRGRVVALDGSPSMVEAAKERLAPFGDRIEYVVADLGKPLPIEGLVDAIVSTATFHWVPDHDALFANLATVLAPGRPAGRTVRRLRQHRLDPTRPGDDRRRLARAGPFRDAARDGDAARCGGVHRHRMLADRRTDPVRARRSARDLPARRWSSAPTSSVFRRRTATVRARGRVAAAGTTDRLRPPEHPGAPLAGRTAGPDGRGDRLLRASLGMDA